MLGWIIAIFLIGFAAFILIRSVVRMARGQNRCTGCGNGNCPHCGKIR